jgi:predicted DNA-binding transcriptional regulator YafY
MAQKDVTKRHMLIINYLQAGPKSFDEIEFKLENASNTYAMDLYVSKRTFQRDIQDIETLYGYEIKFNRQIRKYEIIEPKINKETERILDAYQTIDILNTDKSFSKYMQFEDRKPVGLNFALDIITAIKNRQIIKVYHKKFWVDEFKTYKIKPLLLKEYRYRWYLVGIDCNNEAIKHFGLDRIVTVTVESEKFVYPDNFNFDEYFKYSYGVIYPPKGSQPEEIELSFTPIQGKYVKTLFLHHSQKVVVENDKETRISLLLIPTEHDFMRDILQFGSSVKVIKPRWLADKIKMLHQDAINRYKGN